MDKLICFAAVAFFLAGCSPVSEVVRTDYSSRATRAAHEVEVFMETPKRGYKVIAMIQVGPDSFVADYSSQTKYLIKEAAMLGADAVIVEYSSRVSGYDGMIAESNFTRGKAIIWK
jgi:hypothetical protein